MTTPRDLINAAVALVVIAIELSATLGSLNGEPIELAGWSSTRPGDGWAVLLTVIGSTALFAVLQFPVSAMAVSSGAYIVFILRDYEFGMTLPVMVAIFTLTAIGRHRVLALGAGLVCLTATLVVWVAQRTTTIPDADVTILTWVALGTVTAVFFLLPVFLGELIRLRRLVRAEKEPETEAAPAEGSSTDRESGSDQCRTPEPMSYRDSAREG